MQREDHGFAPGTRDRSPVPPRGKNSDGDGFRTVCRFVAGGEMSRYGIEKSKDRRETTELYPPSATQPMTLNSGPQPDAGISSFASTLQSSYGNAAVER